MEAWERGAFISIREIRKGSQRRFLGAEFCLMGKISRSLHLFGAGDRWVEQHSRSKNALQTLGSG